MKVSSTRSDCPLKSEASAVDKRRRREDADRGIGTLDGGRCVIGCGASVQQWLGCTAIAGNLTRVADGSRRAWLGHT